MHDDVTRSLKESRRFERMSSDDVRDHIDSRWYELVLACDEDEQLAAEHVFVGAPGCHQARPVFVTELEGEGAGARRRSSAAMTLATPAQGRKVLRYEMSDSHLRAACSAYPHPGVRMGRK